MRSKIEIEAISNFDLGFSFGVNDHCFKNLSNDDIDDIERKITEIMGDTVTVSALIPEHNDGPSYDETGLILPFGRGLLYECKIKSDKQSRKHFNVLQCWRREAINLSRNKKFFSITSLEELKYIDEYKELSLKRAVFRSKIETLSIRILSIGIVSIRLKISIHSKDAAAVPLIYSAYEFSAYSSTETTSGKIDDCFKNLRIAICDVIEKKRKYKRFVEISDRIEVLDHDSTDIFSGFHCLVLVDAEVVGLKDDATANQDVKSILKRCEDYCYDTLVHIPDINGVRYTSWGLDILARRLDVGELDKSQHGKERGTLLLEYAEIISSTISAMQNLTLTNLQRAMHSQINNSKKK